MWTRARRPQQVGFALALLVVLSLLLVYIRSPKRLLPYHDSFRTGNLAGWQEYSGDWSVVADSVRNESDERGAKLVTGSNFWTDYVVEADVELLGRGNAGLILRATDLEDGVDAYSGYYAGVSTDDQSLVLGRADHGWIEFPPQYLPDGVGPKRRYHLTLAAQGCVIRAAVTDLATHRRTSSNAYDPNCHRSGKVGLRSVDSGGSWSRVEVHALPVVDPHEQQGMQPTETLLYPTSQREYPHADGLLRTTAPPLGGSLSEFEVQPINRLRLLALPQPTNVTVRGVVVLTTPHVYIQDATGGAEVMPAENTRVKVGDEVQVTGRAQVEGFSISIMDASIASLAGLLPLPAVSITPLQAARGSYDAMFVEVQGRLVSKVHEEGLPIRIRMEAGQQEFYAISSSTEIAASIGKLKVGSDLLLRGICLVSSAYTEKKVPFALVVRSPNDIKVLTGPPWWTPEHLVGMAIVMLTLGYCVHLAYSHMDQRRHQAVVAERERLAMEVHDTLAQSFAGLEFQLRALRNCFTQGSETRAVERIKQELDHTCDLVRQSHDEARRTLTTLRPEILDKAGLSDALSQVGRRMVAASSICMTTEVIGTVRPLPLRVVDACFRIGQEAIANAVKHSHAQKISVALEYTSRTLVLSVTDDGKGFEKEDNNEGFGLTGMRRRAERIQAKLDIQSSGQGTCVTVAAPCGQTGPWPFTPAYIREVLRNHMSEHGIR